MLKGFFCTGENEKDIVFESSPTTENLHEF